MLHNCSFNPFHGDFMSSFTAWMTLFVVLWIVVGVHEFGHYFAMRAVGVRPNRISIGIGPRIIAIRPYQIPNFLQAVYVAASPLHIGMSIQKNPKGFHFAGEFLRRGSAGDPITPNHTEDPRWDDVYFGTLFELRLIPIAGFVIPYEKEISWWRNVIVDVAGPVANLLTVLAVFMLARPMAIYIGHQPNWDALDHFLATDHENFFLPMHEHFMRDGLWAVYLQMMYVSGLTMFINLLPFPPLDGGRAVLRIIEAVVGRKIPPWLFFILALPIFYSVITGTAHEFWSLWVNFTRNTAGGTQ